MKNSVANNNRKKFEKKKKKLPVKSHPSMGKKKNRNNMGAKNVQETNEQNSSLIGGGSTCNTLKSPDDLMNWLSRPIANVSIEQLVSILHGYHSHKNQSVGFQALPPVFLQQNEIVKCVLIILQKKFDYFLSLADTLTAKKRLITYPSLSRDSPINFGSQFTSEIMVRFAQWIHDSPLLQILHSNVQEINSADERIREFGSLLLLHFTVTLQVELIYRKCLHLVSSLFSRSCLSQTLSRVFPLADDVKVITSDRERLFIEIYNTLLLVASKEFLNHEEIPSQEQSPRSKTSQKLNQGCIVKQYETFSSFSINLVNRRNETSTRETISVDFMELTVRTSCIICKEILPNVTEGCQCDFLPSLADGDQSGHFTCWSCLANYIDAAKQPGSISSYVNKEGDLTCPTCKSPYDMLSLSSSAPKVIGNKILDLKIHLKVTEERQIIQREEKAIMQRELEKVMKMDAFHREVEVLRLHIIDDILTLKCPRCSTAFLDFNGCFAIICGNNRCSAGLCAWCLKDCGADAHSHVASCPHNPAKNSGYPYSGDLGELKRVNNGIRLQKIKSLLKDKGADVVKALKEVMKKDFSDLKLAMDF
jgi:hypothetical protein